MAKVTKKMLKGIVKECLVELLSEGLGDSDSDVMLESAPRKASRKKKSIFDEMDKAFERKAHPSDRVTFDKRATQAAEAATSDPLLQSILADTAKTTLQEQLNHESRMPSVPYEGSPPSMGSPLSSGGSAGLDISGLFGEATKNWSEVLERTERKPL